MQRVVVIGSGGAGKSTFAQQLGERLGIDVIHLDALYWRGDWEPCAPDEWRALQEQLVTRDAWIIDGNYGATMDIRLAVADTVIFLDLSRWTCLRSIFLRRLRARRRPRVGNPMRERLTLEFLGYVWRYPHARRPGILRKLAELRPDQRAVVLSSRAGGRILPRVLCAVRGSAGDALLRAVRRCRRPGDRLRAGLVLRPHGVRAAGRALQSGAFRDRAFFAWVRAQ